MVISTTVPLYDISTSFALSKIQITSGQATEIGVCWSLTENPTVDDSKMSETGDYTEGDTLRFYLYPLKSLTTYYAKGYGILNEIITYGNEIQLTTPGSTDSIRRLIECKNPSPEDKSKNVEIRENI